MIGHLIDYVLENTDASEPKGDPSPFFIYDFESVNLPASNDPLDPPGITMSISLVDVLIVSFKDSPLVASQPHLSPRF